MARATNDDAQLTAYALGELAGAERDAVEKRLENDPAARAFVEETRGTAADLSEELKLETSEGLNEKQKRAIHAALAPAKPRRRTRDKVAQPRPRQVLRYGVWGGVAAAAFLLVAIPAFGPALCPEGRTAADAIICPSVEDADGCLQDPRMPQEVACEREGEKRAKATLASSDSIAAGEPDGYAGPATQTFPREAQFRFTDSGNRDPFAVHARKTETSPDPACAEEEPAPQRRVQPEMTPEPPVPPPGPTPSQLPPKENHFTMVRDHPLSTFSIDVSARMVSSLSNTTGGSFPLPGTSTGTISASNQPLDWALAAL